MFKIIFAVYTLLVCQFYIPDQAHAVSFKATTLPEKLGSLGLGVTVLFGFILLFNHFFSKSFMHGFIVATGLFLSVDIILFHWIFQLHRITDGNEANILEPLFVIFGTLFLIYGIRKEKDQSPGEGNC